MKRCFVVLLLIFATACPGTRIAKKNMSGPSDNVSPPMRALPLPALSVITDLRSPESVLHDPDQDVYFISNVNGGMLTLDNNGFISRVDPDSMHVDVEWISGGKAGVTLDAPKGMSILGDTLYVSDITAVRKFDRRTGAPRGEIALPGATFINDIATDGTNLYVSDTGMKLGPGKTFIDTGTEAIWKITNDRAEKIASGSGLGNPNGLDFVNGKLRVVTFGANEMYELEGGKTANVVKLPAGLLDGLAHAPDGSAIVSSWEGSDILRGMEKDSFRAVLAGLNAPADIGYDAKRHRLLLPVAGANQVTIHALQ